MTKFERVLSKSDEQLIIDGLGLNGLLTAVGRKIIQLSEQAILAKLAEQEPVAYLFADMIYGTGDADINENIISKGEPLYAHPKPNHIADASKKVTPLAQRKIQTVIGSGEYRVIENATVLVNKHGHTAIVNPDGAFYWVDNEHLASEFYDAETEYKGEK